MKVNFLKLSLLSALPFFLASACADASNGGAGKGPEGGQSIEDVYEGVISDAMKSEVRNYFSGILSGEDIVFGHDVRLELEYVADNAGAVWSAWREANDRYSEEKLIDIAPLSEASSGKWTLPVELEPSADMPYYLGVKGNRPDGGWPLYLYLHGSGDKESEWATGLSLCGNFNDAPSMYFIPQIPNTGQWYRWWQRSKQYAWEKLLRLAFVSGEVDPDKVFFFGISEGGYGSQRLASFYADYLAGAGPMAGGEPLKNAPAENCANIAFSLRTGAEDSGFGRNRLTGYTKDEFDRLEQLHAGYYEHWVELIPGDGHGIDYSPTTPWLASHERTPWPKYFCWENFEMDGRYRDGFCNIHVIERSNQDASSRTVYEMNIEGNNVNMTVRNVSYETVETVSGIEMKFEKSYEDVSRGRFVIYLNDNLVNLSEPVVVTVNGKTVFEGIPEPSLGMMVSSCALFGDPMRIYPCGVEVNL